MTSYLLEISAGTIDWSRAQFALTAIFHWLFVPLTLGLAVIMFILLRAFSADVKSILMTVILIAAGAAAAADAIPSGAQARGCFISRALASFALALRV